MTIFARGTVRRSAVAAIAMVATFGLAAGPATAQDGATLRVSYETPAPHIKSRTIEVFKEQLDEISGGWFNVELYPSAQLVGPSEEVAATARGQIEMSAPYFSYLAPVEPLMNIYQVPLVFDSYPQLWAFLETDEAKELAATLESRGLQPGGYWFENPARVWGKEPIDSLEDFSGKKIRVVPSEILQDAVSALDAQPTAIPGTELYLALQQGVADGAITAPNYGLAMKFYEVTEATTNLDVFYGGYMVLFNKRWFDGLPAERQEQLMEAVAAARAFNEENVQKDLAQIDSDLEAVGQTVIQPSDEMVANFREKLQPFYENLDPKIQSMIETVRSLQ